MNILGKEWTPEEIAAAEKAELEFKKKTVLRISAEKDVSKQMEKDGFRFQYIDRDSFSCLRTDFETLEEQKEAFKEMFTYRQTAPDNWGPKKDYDDIEKTNILAYCIAGHYPDIPLDMALEIVPEYEKALQTELNPDPHKFIDKELPSPEDRCLMALVSNGEQVYEPSESLTVLSVPDWLYSKDSLVLDACNAFSKQESSPVINSNGLAISLNDEKLFFTLNEGWTKEHSSEVKDFCESVLNTNFPNKYDINITDSKLTCCIESKDGEKLTAKEIDQITLELQTAIIDKNLELGKDKNKEIKDHE